MEALDSHRHIVKTIIFYRSIGSPSTYRYIYSFLWMHWSAIDKFTVTWHRNL